MSVSPPTADQKMNLPNYSVREAEQHEFPIIYDFLTEHFYKDIPTYNNLILTKKIEITEEEEKLIIDLRRKLINCTLENYPALVVVDKDCQKIVAANLTAATQNPAYKHDKNFVNPFELNRTKSKILAEHVRYLHELKDSVNIYEKFPEAKSVLEFYFVSVKRNYRNSGLSTFLLRKSIDYARKQGFDLASGLFVSTFSKKAAHKVGFKSMQDWNLLEHRDSKGVQLTNLPENYENASYMVISLNK